MLENPSHKKWFFPIKTAFHPSYKLYCFPYAGGSNTTYRDWADRFPNHLNIYTASLPGRGIRSAEGLSGDIWGISEEIAKVISSSNEINFSFYGHSFGAILAFEVACRLKEQQVQLPEKLIVSGCNAPHITNTTRPPAHKMNDQEFRSYIDLLNGIPEEVKSTPALMDYILPILKADIMAMDTWENKSKLALATPITAIMGDSDPVTDEVSVAKWRDYTTSDFEALSFPGGHFFINTCKTELLKKINEILFRSNHEPRKLGQALL